MHLLPIALKPTRPRSILDVHFITCIVKTVQSEKTRGGNQSNAQPLWSKLRFVFDLQIIINDWTICYLLSYIMSTNTFINIILSIISLEHHYNCTNLGVGIVRWKTRLNYLSTKKPFPENYTEGCTRECTCESVLPWCCAGVV